MSAAVDWSKYQFLGDGAGGGKYTDKYKVEKVEGIVEIVNIQQPGWAKEAGIYITFPAGITSCSVSGDIQGAGMIMHLSAFTAQETEVTVVHALGTVVFHVYYADGGSTSVIDKPRMISASLERVDMNNAYVRVDATDAVTPFADLTYECILTQGEHVYQFTISATNGILHTENMPACAEHTLKIRAINKAGKKSDNSARVDFTT
ncbi:MAG: hypothetical protein SOY26_03490, partial [Paludibacteraceae bacterium]|nr:hypothetical protein [Paludibacteraceae bacterium]